MVILQQDFLPKIKDLSIFSSVNFDMIAILVLPIITLMAGLLMVTRIPYPHVMNRLLRGKKRFSTFLLVVFTLLFVIWNIQLAMAVGFCVFMLYGLIRWLVSPSKREPQKAAPSADEN
jgi:phosphatidylserine synthase